MRELGPKNLDPDISDGPSVAADVRLREEPGEEADEDEEEDDENDGDGDEGDDDEGYSE
jgi:hypothetical protein